MILIGRHYCWFNRKHCCSTELYVRHRLCCDTGLMTERACPSCLEIKTAKFMSHNSIIQSADWFCTSVWSYKFRLISLIDSYRRTGAFLLSQRNCITKSKSSSFNSTGQNDKSTLTSGERWVVDGEKETNESMQHSGWGWLLLDLLHYCVLIQLRARPERGSHYRGPALISLSSHILQHYLGTVSRLFCADLGLGFDWSRCALTPSSSVFEILFSNINK